MEAVALYMCCVRERVLSVCACVCFCVFVCVSDCVCTRMPLLGHKCKGNTAKL